jgi:hypothetical protein
MRRRDAIDSSREVAPLKAAEDAVILKTDGKTFGQTVAAVLRDIRDAEKRLAGGSRPAAGGNRPAVEGDWNGR